MSTKKEQPKKQLLLWQRSALIVGAVTAAYLAFALLGTNASAQEADVPVPPEQVEVEVIEEIEEGGTETSSATILERLGAAYDYVKSGKTAEILDTEQSTIDEERVVLHEAQAEVDEMVQLAIQKEAELLKKEAALQELETMTRDLAEQTALKAKALLTCTATALE